MAYFWNGPGVFSHKGKDHLPGEEIKGLDKKQAESMIKKGTLSDEAPKAGRPSSELSQLREQVKELAEQLKNAPSADDFEALTAERDELAEKLSASENSVAELTEQLVKVQKEAADVTAAAGPKK